MVAAEIITAAWQLLRVAQLRAGLLTDKMDEARRHEYAHPMSFSLDTYGALSRLDRHHALLQRTVERNLKLLSELQAEEAEQNEPTEATDYADSTEETEVQNEPTVPQPLCSVPLGDATELRPGDH
jgi:hypothetical protein